jgi:enterochelin esterase-like enzyme
MTLLLLASALLVGGTPPTRPANDRGRSTRIEIPSRQFTEARVGARVQRSALVYLPPGYDSSAGRYPVIYYLANMEGAESLMLKDSVHRVFDSAVAAGEIPPFILVAPEVNTPVGTSWCVNSPVTGGWDTFLSTELVAYVDTHLRTHSAAASRGLLGDRMGGYCALRLGMYHANTFGSVYALHPVGTGSGVQIMHARPDWPLLAGAASIDTVRRDVLSAIFLSIFQAHLPNRDSGPLFVDLPAARDIDGTLRIDAAMTDRLRESFLLESHIGRRANALRSLRGLKFDWGRNDWNTDHVFANQAFTHKLNEYGILHDAEEYDGAWGDRHWGPTGRVRTDVLPFFRRMLSFH